MFTRHDVRFKTAAQNQHLAFHRTAIDEFQKTETFVVRNGEHRAERCFDSFREQASLFFRGSRRITEDARERIAKTARRSESAFALDLVDAIALAHLAQRQTHSPRAMIRLKGHSVVTLELPARRRRID